MFDECISQVLFMRGRARLALELRGVLDDGAAQELATRIVQALMDGRGDPMSVALSMLPGLDVATRRIVAARLAMAYYELNRTPLN